MATQRTSSRISVGSDHSWKRSDSTNSLSSTSSQDSSNSRRSSSICDSTTFANELTKPHDALIKVITLGESAVGKSAIMTRILDGEFRLGSGPTIGIDFGIKMVDIDGKRVKMQLWDTAGQERFRTITRAYMNGADGVYLVFDVTRDETFLKLRSWMRSLEKHDPDNLLPKVLIGNKIDLQDQRQVSREAAQEYADSLGLEYFETSAFNFSDSIASSMESLLRQTLSIKSFSSRAGRADDKAITLSKGEKVKERLRSCC